MKWTVTGLVAGSVLLAALAWRLAPALFAGEFSQTFAPQPHDWATSDTCRACHLDQHASWHRTFHRTMTQEADAGSVLGRFDGQVYRYWGVGVRPIERDGGYFFEYLDDNDALIVRLPVLRTIGSRRYQQYLTQTPDGGETYFRMHLLWHMDDQRWMHINGVFLRPDEQGFDDRVAVWNHNCIFCHNTGPRPNVVNLEELRQRELAGLRVDSAMESRYDSEVAELGIACESCHGPGEEHAQRNRNPLRRLALQLTNERDPTIVHPAKVGQERGIAICGQCHGQRTPPSREHLMQWIRTGPTFRAGERLTDHVIPVFQDYEVPRGIDPDLFRLRFWEDGTARLTAYEYQGVVQSKCHDDSEFTCLSCHALHSGDVHGNIPEENRSNKPCLACHTEFSDDVSTHTKHEADSSGSLCYDCHMPRMVFGVTGIHRSHRIELPRPAENAANNRPDACTNCHLARSSDWAAQAIQALWHDADLPRDRAPARLLESLHGGDPVQRAVAAQRAGTESADGSDGAWLVPHLLIAMEDHYPSTRNLSRKGLLAIDTRLGRLGVDLSIREDLEAFDFIGDAAQRARLIESMRKAWRTADKSGWADPPAGALLDDAWEPLQPLTRDLVAIGHSNVKQIAIGE